MIFIVLRHSQRWQTVVSNVFAGLLFYSKNQRLTDAVNNARAMRIAEIVNDFRTVQNAIAAIRANPSAEDYNEEGFAVLRRCVQESQVLLIHPFQATLVGSASDEQNKQHSSE